MSSFLKRFKVIARHQRGATAIEYGLIAALIAVAAVGAMSNLGGQLKKTFNNTQTQMAKG